VVESPTIDAYHIHNLGPLTASRASAVTEDLVRKVRLMLVVAHPEVYQMMTAMSDTVATILYLG